MNSTEIVQKGNGDKRTDSISEHHCKEGSADFEYLKKNSKKNSSRWKRKSNRRLWTDEVKIKRKTNQLQF